MTLLSELYCWAALVHPTKESRSKSIILISCSNYCATTRACCSKSMVKLSNCCAVLTPYFSYKSR